MDRSAAEVQILEYDMLRMWGYSKATICGKNMDHSTTTHESNALPTLWYMPNHQALCAARSCT